jgi:hypothetical protein
MAHPSSNNQTGLDQVQNVSTMDHAHPPNNESVAGTTQVCDVAPITCREDWLDLYLLPFLLFFSLLNLIIFQQHTLYAMMGMAKTQPTEGVWPCTPHQGLANINGQPQIYFEG